MAERALTDRMREERLHSAASTLARLGFCLLVACVSAAPAAAALNDTERPGYVATEAEEQLSAELRRQMVFFRTTEVPGTIVVHTQERFLYLVQGNNRAIRYGIGVGREGFQWTGLKRSTARRNGPIGLRRRR